ncbi:MAG: hypothetical protein QNJ74_07740 [Trichodesmium sp. MO_231.B1]|nr:hypothetical protein [Trichodesmium sp. MO_231.B1]
MKRRRAIALFFSKETIVDIIRSAITLYNYGDRFPFLSYQS